MRPPGEVFSEWDGVGGDHDLVRGKHHQRIGDREQGIGVADAALCVHAALLELIQARAQPFGSTSSGSVFIRHPSP